MCLLPALFNNIVTSLLYTLLIDIILKDKFNTYFNSLTITLEDNASLFK
jgi:hypothetical protein